MQYVIWGQFDASEGCSAAFQALSTQFTDADQMPNNVVQLR